jgi:hypothetical protein
VRASAKFAGLNAAKSSLEALSMLALTEWGAVGAKPDCALSCVLVFFIKRKLKKLKIKR